MKLAKTDGGSLQKDAILLKRRAMILVMSYVTFTAAWCFLDSSLSLTPEDERCYAPFFLFAIVLAIIDIYANPRYWAGMANECRSYESGTRKRAQRYGLWTCGVCLFLLFAEALFDFRYDSVSAMLLFLGFKFLESALGLAFDSKDGRDAVRRAENVPKKKEVDSFRCLLELLKGKERDFDLCIGGKEIANLLRTQKLVLLVGKKTLATLFRTDVDYEINGQLAKRDRAIFSAEEILKAAKKRKLHPVVFKGLAFERCIYGDIARRDAGDLDLLVRKEEVPAVHKLLLSLGYRQQTGPSSAGGVRQSRALAAVRASQNEVDDASKQKGPVRRHPYKGELSPYVRIDSPTVEVHDGFAQLPVWFLNEVIEKAKKGFAADPLHNLIFLLANAYENSESLFSNCFDYGVVLRDCVDIREFWLVYGEKLDWGAAERLVDEVGLRDKAARVLGDLDELYGRETMADFLPGIERDHGYGRPCFLERAHDEEAAREIALPFFRREVEKKALPRLVGVDNVNDVLASQLRPVMRFVRSGERPEILILEVDAAVLPGDDRELLQIAFYYLDGSCDAVGYKVTLRCIDGRLQAVGNESRRLLNGAALLKNSGVRFPISIIGNDEPKYVHVELDCLPERIIQSINGRGIAVDASIFVHNHSNVYWRQNEPVAMIMDEVALGNLWLMRDGWNSLLVQFGSIELNIAANDLTLLDDLHMLFPNSCINSLAPALRVSMASVTAQKDGVDSYSVMQPNGEVKLGLNRSEALGLILQLIMDLIVASAVGSIAALHAAALVHNNKAVLFVGASGSGKSSLAYVLKDTLPLLGDECVFLNMESGTAWCEEYPANIKLGNGDIVSRIPIGKSIRAEWGGKSSLYCQIDTSLHGEFEISHVFVPHYGLDVVNAAFKDVECSELVSVIAGSLLGDVAQSELFARFVRMASRCGIKVVGLVYSDVDAASELVLHELDGDSGDFQVI